MDLLIELNTCSKEKVRDVINKYLNEKIASSEKNKKLGFKDGILETSKIDIHKGFISPDSRIKYSNMSMNSYSMKTMDFYYSFGEFINEKKISDKGNLVKNLENFILNYFGYPSINDERDDYFYKITWDLNSTDDEYFDKLDNLEIGNLKGKNIAMCTERAALAQNILSLFNFDTYYCMGCVNNNEKEEAHAFNIVRARDKYILLDYSIPVPVIVNNRIVDYAPFQGEISLDEIEDILLNGIDKVFNSYEYIKTNEGIKKVTVDEYRTYKVGYLKFEEEKKPIRR